MPLSFTCPFPWTCASVASPAIPENRHPDVLSNSYHRRSRSPSKPFQSLSHVFTPKSRPSTHAGFHSPSLLPDGVARRKADRSKQNHDARADDPCHQRRRNQRILGPSSSLLPSLTSVFGCRRFPLSLVSGRLQSRRCGRASPSWSPMIGSMLSRYHGLGYHPQR